MDGISYHLTMDMNASSLCQDCGLVFTEKWMLKEHKRVAHDERVIKCDIAPRTSTYKSSGSSY